MNSELPTITIDADGVCSTDDFWQRYLDATNPDGASYFGRNLDAFWDAIEGGGPGYPGPVELRFTNMDSLKKFSVGNGESMLAAFEKIALEATQTHIVVER